MRHAERPEEIHLQVILEVNPGHLLDHLPRERDAIGRIRNCATRRAHPHQASLQEPVEWPYIITRWGLRAWTDLIESRSVVE